eukprot:5226780-Alexandrium_andersonii.AAC.1
MPTSDLQTRVRLWEIVVPQSGEVLPGLRETLQATVPGSAGSTWWKSPWATGALSQKAGSGNSPRLDCSVGLRVLCPPAR